MLYKEVFRELEKAQVRYLVVGGIAVVLHGYLRFTADLDIFPSFASDQIEKLIEVLTRLGYKPKAPVKAKELADPAKRMKWAKEKGMKVFSFVHPDKPLELIDIFIEEPLEFDRSYRDKEIMHAEGVNIPIACIKDMIELKRLAGRPQDQQDIEALEEINAKKNKKK